MSLRVYILVLVVSMPVFAGFPVPKDMAIDAVDAAVNRPSSGRQTPSKVAPKQTSNFNLQKTIDATHAYGKSHVEKWRDVFVAPTPDQLKVWAATPWDKLSPTRRASLLKTFFPDIPLTERNGLIRLSHFPAKTDEHASRANLLTMGLLSALLKNNQGEKVDELLASPIDNARILAAKLHLLPFCLEGNDKILFSSEGKLRKPNSLGICGPDDQAVYSDDDATLVAIRDTLIKQKNTPDPKLRSNDVPTESENGSVASTQTVPQGANTDQVANGIDGPATDSVGGTTQELPQFNTESDQTNPNNPDENSLAGGPNGGGGGGGGGGGQPNPQDDPMRQLAMMAQLASAFMQGGAGGGGGQGPSMNLQPAQLPPLPQMQPVTFATPPPDVSFSSEMAQSLSAQAQTEEQLAARQAGFDSFLKQVTESSNWLLQNVAQMGAMYMQNLSGPVQAPGAMGLTVTASGNAGLGLFAQRLRGRSAGLLSGTRARLSPASLSGTAQAMSMGPTTGSRITNTSPGSSNSRIIPTRGLATAIGEQGNTRPRRGYLPVRNLAPKFRNTY